MIVIYIVVVHVIIASAKVDGSLVVHEFGISHQHVHEILTGTPFAHTKGIVSHAGITGCNVSLLSPDDCAIVSRICAYIGKSVLQTAYTGASCQLVESFNDRFTLETVGIGNSGI